MPIKKICIVTTGSPSSNPRVAKQADALIEAGYAVRVIGAYTTAWAERFDAGSRARRRWRYETAGGTPTGNALCYWSGRLRHKAVRLAAVGMPGLSLLDAFAIERATPDLERAAKREPADLYIAHYLPALIAASRAAERRGAKLGFDAEDFHSGQLSAEPGSPLMRRTVRIEKKYIPRCDFVTASSPGIAEEYQDLCALAKKPVVILNVFPLAMMPAEIRQEGPAGRLTLFWFSQTVGPDRGIEDVIRAMGVIKDNRVELHLLGNFMKGYRKILFDLMDSEGVSPDRIVFHETMDPDELARFSADFDVGLAVEKPSEYNRELCLSNKIFTYLLAGNAVIATSTPAQKALAGSLGEAVRFYPPGDVARLAEGIRCWLKDPAALLQARRAARAAAEKTYNWDLEKEKLLALVGSLG